MCDLNESHLALGRITDALFCSGLEAGAVLTGSQVGQAVNEALSAHRDWNGLTRAVRAAFAKAPAEAACREEWCRRVAEAALSSADLTSDRYSSLA
ncbi:hypothetical protein ABIA31_006887 [Catenulispora sp. MAP5-51]|uniref:hypothetical protein n=1 Tax=Catenulispora sp. MAP5-51 TaxID=3156298 RepID=UPI003512E27D